MKIQAIGSYLKPNNHKPKKVQNVSFGGYKFPENGWCEVSGIDNYRCFDGIWSVPAMVILGFIHRNNLNVYTENSKPVMAYVKQNDNSLHCLFGNGSYYPYAWVYFKPNGQDNINDILNDADNYTVVTEKGEVVDGIKLSHDNRCTVCQKSIFYPSDWGEEKETCVPVRYLEILKKHLEQDKPRRIYRESVYPKQS